MSLNIQPVRTSADLDLFIDLPRRLYGRDPRYQPPMTLDRKNLLHPDRASFFSHGEAQYWLALRDGAACGRISAQIDRAATGELFRGMFGCFDCVDDPLVAQALLEAAEAWLAARGVNEAHGPCLLSINGEAGLLVDGQAEPPLIMTPWHPEYLATLLEGCGYAKTKDLFHLRLDITPQALEAAAGDLRLSRRRSDHLRVRPLSQLHAGRDIETLRTIYNDAWRNNWGFVPLTREDMSAFKGSLRVFLKSEYGIFVDREGQTVGMALVLPNLSEMSADLGVNPGPLGLLRLIWRGLTKKFTSARVILMGVSAEHAGTLEGVAIAMTLLDELLKLAGRNRLSSVEGGWVLEDNRAVLAIYDRFRARRVRTLRLFKKRLTK